MKLDTEQAAEVLAQLGNSTRLRIVRLLVKAGPAGLPVGALQRELDVPGSTLSHHVSHLRNAGVVSQERCGASLRCTVDFDCIAAVVGFLTDECCVGVKPRGSKKTMPHEPNRSQA